MPGLDSFLWGGPAAIVAAAAAFAVAVFAARRGAIAWTAGVVAGFAVGAFVLDAHTHGFAAAASRFVRPVEAHGRLPLIALVAAAPASAVAVSRRSWTLWLIAAPCAVLAPLWLLWGGRFLPSRELRDAGFADAAWSPLKAAAILGAVAAATLAARWAWLRTISHSQPFARSILTALALAGAAATVACTGSITYAHLLALLAIAVGVSAIGAWISGKHVGPEAAAGPILLPAAGLLLLAVCYSELHLWQAIALALLITVSASRLPLANRGPAVAAAIRAALVLIPLTIIAGQAAIELAASQRVDADAANDPYTVH